jgi:hypothetical protein
MKDFSQDQISGKFWKCLPAWRNVKYQHEHGRETNVPLPRPFGLAPSGQGGGILYRVLLQCVAASRPQTALLAAELHILELCQAMAGQETALQLLV